MRRSHGRSMNEGHEDLRKYGPFNVDRAPSGQLVKKGSIDNPIDEYPESKTKLRQSGNEGEMRNRSSRDNK